MQSLRLFIVVAGCSALVLACGYAASECSVHNQLKAAAGVVVNRAAKQDRLDIGQLALAFEAMQSR